MSHPASRNVSYALAALFCLLTALAFWTGCGSTSNSGSSSPTASNNPPATGGQPGTSGSGGSSGSGGTSGSTGGSGSSGGSSGSGGSGSGSGSSGSGSTGSGSPQLTLVTASALQEGVLVPDALWADANYVYLANFDGHLRVIAKNQSGFPVLGDVAAAVGLYSVRGDGTSVYATATGGELIRFANQPPFSIQSTASYGPTSLFSLDVNPLSSGSILVSQDGAQFAADAAHVYLSALNVGESAMAISKTSGQVTTTYQVTPFDNTITAVFDRSGTRIGTIKNPISISGGLTAASYYSQNGILAIFDTGNSGENVYLYDASTLQPLGSLFVINPNAVAIIKNWLIVGTEAGLIEVFDISKAAADQFLMPVAEINLKTTTSHTGFEDIEIRALWAEDTGNGVRIYAGSDWGDPSVHDPAYQAQLPTFFVLDLK
jgi:hypothetical protein